MLTYLAIIIRIFSNSYLNVFQKVLSQKGQKSSVINFYTYLGLTLISAYFLCGIDYNNALLINTLIMGFLGTLGNYFIIKALSIGELSVLAPINSYKPIVALVLGMIFLNEYPRLISLFAIVLIIFGTLIITKNSDKTSVKAVFYRVMALVFSGTEAIFIKKVILLTNVSAGFALWCLSGFFFGLIFLIFSKNKPIIKSYKNQLFLIISVGVMQLTTNYVFSKMNVSYALALFQLSTLISVFLGVNIFNEDGFIRKLIGSIVMVSGAVILLLFQI